MITLLFIIGFLTYFATVYGMYTPAIKNHPWYVQGSMVFGVLFSWTWPTVVKLSSTPEQIYFRGMIWDTMLVCCYAFLPFLFGFKPTPITLLGGVIAVAGLLIMKLGSS